MKKVGILLFAYWLLSLSSRAQSANDDRYPVIPYPASLVPGQGVFVLSARTRLHVDFPRKRIREFRKEAGFLRQLMHRYTGKTATANNILIVYNPYVRTPEGYSLAVDERQIRLGAASPAGLFMGIQTLRQLLSPDPATLTATVPAVTIEDHPEYAWRGLMLDVSRHFFSIDYLKKFIDQMAFYKLNKLHLHLTDDQGWRIEIKKYRRLTTEGAWRTLNNWDSSCLRLAKSTGNPDFGIDSSHLRVHDGQTQYGGFYTQHQMKDLISYAASRHIEIIPEVDMPGHMMAAIGIYPWLSCGTPVADRKPGYTTPMCPCKDSVLAFAKDVFSEIIRLFPSRYIHIGGDEVEKRDWDNSPLVRDFMRQHKIKDYDQLQTWFNGVLQAFFRAHGKTLIGWDEIADAGQDSAKEELPAVPRLDSSAIVMYWRTWSKPSLSRATRNGNFVVMSPDGPMYFDVWPDSNSLRRVYHYNPADTAYRLDAAQQQKILGVQGNLWTERVPTEKRADYLVMPRMTALAELGWTHKDLYASYIERLKILLLHFADSKADGPGR
jgi:hexosaminidase